MREVFLLLRLNAALRVNDQTRFQKQVGDAYGLGQKAAGIIAQIEHQAFHPTLLRRKLFKRAL